MPFFRHDYRCRCGDWDKNRVQIFTEESEPPFKRTQHFQVREGVGIHPGCQNWITWLGTQPHTGTVPPSSEIGAKAPRGITPSAKVNAVAFGPDLLIHVLKGQVADGRATGYHSFAQTTLTGEAPYRILESTHLLAEWERISRRDEWGVYYIQFRLQATTGARETTPWKVSTMFPDRMSASTVERAIRTAAVNRRSDTSPSVDWAGLHDNGMRVGGRTMGNGSLKSAFPAYRGSFDIPDFVSNRLR